MGHLETDGRMGRNYIKGYLGDRINPILVATGYNFRLVVNWMASLISFAPLDGAYRRRCGRRRGDRRRCSAGRGRRSSAERGYSQFEASRGAAKLTELLPRDPCAEDPVRYLEYEETTLRETRSVGHT